MITVESLTKRYGDKLAVDDLCFEVRPGAVTGFLGPERSPGSPPRCGWSSASTVPRPGVHWSPARPFTAPPATGCVTSAPCSTPERSTATVAPRAPAGGRRHHR